MNQIYLSSATYSKKHLTYFLDRLVKVHYFILTPGTLCGEVPEVRGGPVRVLSPSSVHHLGVAGRPQMLQHNEE